MLTQTRTDIAALLPGPSELLPGCPDAIIDLQTEAGVELVGAQWRYSDARVREIEFVEVGHPRGSARTRPRPEPDVRRRAPCRGHATTTTRTGAQLTPEETQLRLSQGRVCFNWYRIAVTIPERVGDFDPDRRERRVRGRDRRLRRGVGQRRAAARARATPAATSPAASTHPTACC